MNYEKWIIGKIVDPPSGWQFGFPAVFNPIGDETLEEWLIRMGYPKEHVDFGVNHLRVIRQTNKGKPLLAPFYHGKMAGSRKRV